MSAELTPRLRERIEALRPRALEFTLERAGFEDGLDAVLALLPPPIPEDRRCTCPDHPHCQRRRRRNRRQCSGCIDMCGPFGSRRSA